MRYDPWWHWVIQGPANDPANEDDPRVDLPVNHPRVGGNHPMIASSFFFFPQVTQSNFRRLQGYELAVSFSYRETQVSFTEKI